MLSLDTSEEQKPAPETSGTRTSSSARASERAARTTFAVVTVVAFFMYLIVGRHMSFWFDEFDFLAARSLNFHDVFEPHGGHLVALPVVVFRALYFVVGMRSYLPYQALAVLTHLVVAVLLRVIMRRAGVGPWVATAAATLFVFFGVGGQDILWAFQITFSGALAFGLGQLLLADHDGPIDRRDWLGLACGLAALLCSAVAVSTIAVVGLVLLVRGRWRAALFHAVPLAALYGFYWLQSDHGAFFTTNTSLLWRWDRRGVAALFDSIGQIRFVGWVLGALLVAGLVLAWHDRDRATRRATLAAPLMLLIGMISFLTITGTTRVWAGIDYVASSRYLYVAAALVIPALGVAADAFVRRSRFFAPVVFVLLLVGIPGNIGATTDFAPMSSAAFARYERAIRALGHADLAQHVPGSVHPDPNVASEITVEWLRDAAASGRLPTSGTLSPREAASVQLRLSLAQTNVGNGASCDQLSEPIVLDLRVGQSFTVVGSVLVQLRRDDGALSDPLSFGTSFISGAQPHTLTVVAGPLHITVDPNSGTLGTPAAICPGVAALPRGP